MTYLLTAILPWDKIPQLHREYVEESLENIARSANNRGHSARFSKREEAYTAMFATAGAAYRASQILNGRAPLWCYHQKSKSVRDEIAEEQDRMVLKEITSFEDRMAGLQTSSQEAPPAKPDREAGLATWEETPARIREYIIACLLDARDYWMKEVDASHQRNLSARQEIAMCLTDAYSSAVRELGYVPPRQVKVTATAPGTYFYAETEKG